MKPIPIRQLVLITILSAFLWAHQPVDAADNTAPQNPSSQQPAAEKGDADPKAGSSNSVPPIEDWKAIKYFNDGYKYFDKENYLAAAQEFFKFLQAKTPDDLDYEWAEFFFGISLKELGFSHASIDLLSELVVRKPNPKIVNYTLELLEEVARTRPFDQELVIHKVICDHTYEFVEGRTADFVNYYQGEYDWEHGFFHWGDAHFEKITPDSYYYYKYLYKKALFEIHDDRIDNAISTLNVILNGPEKADFLRNDVRKTLARLYYEVERFEEADLLYRKIEMSILEQAQNLLERAWIHYRLGHPERSMGLLYSFEAPSFRNSFTPEFFILKSFIYKDVCHYQKAMKIINEFKSRYGDSIDNIYNRGKMENNHALMLVILTKNKINRLWKFLNLLEKERADIDKLKDDDLKAYIDKIYALQIRESGDLLREWVNDEYEAMANELLRFEEEAHLMEYEIGLDMYQRVYQSHYDEESEPEEPVSDKGIAIYKFQGEFWNDELDNYQVVLPNKCKNMEEWDVFFK